LRPKIKGKLFNMEPLREFAVPLKGLKSGLHQYHFEVDDSFFKNFEKSPIGQGRFSVDLEVERGTDLFTIQFKIQGRYECSCDRCLAPIELPIQHQEQLILKYAVGIDDDEVIYLDPQSSEWNAARIIYEMICMAMPLSNVYDCDGIVCNQEVLKKLEKFEKTDSDTSPLWENLKDIKLN